MAALTTRQRDLLQLLLDATAPIGSAELAAQMHLTPRQVNYGLKGLKRWLRQQDITLRMTPGVGVELACTAEQSQILAHKLDSVSHFQLVLTSEQRQQLLALTLLLADEPFILIQLQQLMNVSRTTILADLDAMETWVERQGLTLERRPNYGIRIGCEERLRRRALTALLWGEAPFAVKSITWPCYCAPPTSASVPITRVKSLLFVPAGWPPRSSSSPDSRRVSHDSSRSKYYL